MSFTKAASLADDLVARFTSDIESGVLTPGDRFPTEKALTESFGVSRTVVREAFARLAAQGLLESRRGSGAYVAPHARYRAFQVMPEDLAAIEDVLKLLEMRTALEMEMAALAAVRRDASDLDTLAGHLEAMEMSEDGATSMTIDRAFHVAIARATRNDYYVRFTDFLGLRLIPSRRLYLVGEGAMKPQEYARLINADHRAIYQAIFAGDPDTAREAARLHMRSSYERYAALRDRELADAPGIHGQAVVSTEPAKLYDNY
jgi:GntR family transcriptional regulator, transcriptional repressor for pyruvate dehydrogenase complex